jgi:hypothetical protein
MKKKPAGLPGTAGRTYELIRRPDLSAVSQTSRQIIERFKEDYERLERTLAQLERSPVFTGRPGCLALDVLERIDKFRDTYRQKVKDYLTEYPGTIPHWTAEMQGRRILSRDTVGVYDALESVIPELPAAEFLKYCSTSISGLIRLLKLEGLSPDQINARLEEVLSEDLLVHEVVVSLRRDKEDKP